MENFKQLVSQYVLANGRLNANFSKAYNALAETIRAELNIEPQIEPMTILYSIHTNKAIHRCNTCNRQTNIYNFTSGKFKDFCSWECKHAYKFKAASGVVYTDYESLLTKDSTPAQAKINKYMNVESIAELKKTAGIDTDDIKTLLYAVLKDKTKLANCVECSSLIPVRWFTNTPYVKDKKFCSNTCRNNNDDYRNNIKSKKSGIKRKESITYRDNVGRPWFDEKIKKILTNENVVVNCTYDQYCSGDNTIETLYECKCNSCNSIFKAKLSRIPWCKKCNYYSKPQKDLVNFLDSFGLTTLVNDRQLITPYELDIIIPKLKLAIEYDGLYFHRDKNDYHKYELCKSIGYRLVKIFSDEPITIVKSRLAAIVGKTETKIYARKCSVVNISNKDYEVFLTNNHIQGHAAASRKYGLMYENELVAVMSFGKTRFNKTTEWELIRFANKINTAVVGGASKLFKHFITQEGAASVISYCDIRWGTGAMYEALGFTLQHQTKPGYSWYKNKRESRMKFQKHKLKALFENVDMTKTEDEIMKENGYSKIYDFGNLAFLWSVK